MEFEGTLIHDLPEEGGTSKAGNVWRKKTWVFEVPSGQYTNQIAVTCMGDRINNMNFEMGKRYIVSIDVQSREFNGKWYTDARVYAYRPVEDATTSAPQGGFGTPVSSATASAAPAADPFAAGSSDTDDLPF